MSLLLAADKAQGAGNTDLYEVALKHRERAATNLAELESLVKHFREKLQNRVSEECYVCAEQINTLQQSREKEVFVPKHLNSPGNQLHLFLTTLLCEGCHGQLDVIQAARALFETHDKLNSRE